MRFRNQVMNFECLFQEVNPPSASTLSNSSIATPGCRRAMVPMDEQELRLNQVTPQTYSCAECAQSFYSELTYARHRGRHCWDQGYGCFGCRKHFSSLPELLAHHAGHIEDDLHRCPGCDSRFGDINDLTAHCQTYGAMERLAERFSEVVVVYRDARRM